MCPDVFSYPNGEEDQVLPFALCNSKTGPLHHRRIDFDTPKTTSLPCIISPYYVISQQASSPNRYWISLTPALNSPVQQRRNTSRNFCWKKVTREEIVPLPTLALPKRCVQELAQSHTKAKSNMQSGVNAHLGGLHSLRSRRTPELERHQKSDEARSDRVDQRQDDGLSEIGPQVRVEVLALRDGYHDHSGRARNQEGPEKRGSVNKHFASHCRAVASFVPGLSENGATCQSPCEVNFTSVTALSTKRTG